MSSDENNQLRLVAARVIHALWERGDTVQLELLQMQIEASIAKPYSTTSREALTTGEGE